MGANQGNVDPKAVAKTILSELSELSREPFSRELSKALSNAPSGTDYRSLAQQDPEKWSRAVFALARLAGFTNTSDHRHLHVHKSEPALLLEVYRAFGEQAYLKTAKELGYSETEAKAKLAELQQQTDSEAATIEGETETEDEDILNEGDNVGNTL